MFFGDENPSAGTTGTPVSNKPETGPTVEANNLGEAPEFPSIFIAYNEETKKLELRNRRGGVISQCDLVTVKGKDGADAYHLWKNGQRAGADTSFEAFLEAFKGADGQQGLQGPAGPKGEPGDVWVPMMSPDGDTVYFRNSAGEETSRFPIRGLRGEQGLQGIQGPTGPQGEKGEAWIPIVTGDGCYIYFRSPSGEETERFLIKGVKGDQGEQGVQGVRGETGPVYVPRINADGTLSWTNNGDDLPNPTPVNIKGERGEKGDTGVTFQPVVKDGVLYWINDQGKENPDPVRIAGPQGERGETGQRGLSAYEIWLKAGNLGTEEDFLASLKGEQGDPFDPTKIVEFNVEDYTCPIQMIDTQLIVDKCNPHDDAESLINQRVAEIEQLRAEGREQATGFKYWINPVNILKEFTWICAGADRPLLRRCPGDHSKYVGIGTVILFTALMAWFSSFIAMQLVFDVENTSSNNIYAIIFATFWSAMIFCLDRFITNTMYSDGKVSISKQEFFSGLPRIVIAIFLGIIISAPLELKIFEDAIEQKQKEIAYDELTERIQGSKQGVLEATAAKKREIDENIKRLENLRDREIEGLTKPENPIVKAGDPSRTKSVRVNVLEDNTSFTLRWNQYLTELEQYNKGERDIKPEEPKKKVVGYKYETVSDPLPPTYQYNDNEYSKMTAEYDKEVSEIQERYKKLILKESEALNNVDIDAERALQVDSLRIASIEDERDNALLSRLSVLHDLAMEGYEPYNGGEQNTFIDVITLHPVWYYLLFSPIGLIMLLFILIDISPVLYKMMLADGKYDNYMHQDKLLAQDKIRLSLAKMLRNLNDSELKRVAPFVMGDIYEKMAGDSYIYKTEEEYKAEFEAQKDTHPIWRLWPLSMFRWLFWKEESKPSAPIVVMEDKRVSKNEALLTDVNDQVFEEVLDMKRRLIVASYRRWYKTQHYKVDPNSEDNLVPPSDVPGDGSTDTPEA